MNREEAIKIRQSFLRKQEKHLHKVQLVREFIRKSIKSYVNEQKSLLNEQWGGNPDCTKWWTSGYQSDMINFISTCCDSPEGCITNNLGSGALQYCGDWANTTQYVAQNLDPCDCCGYDTSSMGDGCEDPLWVSMPMGSNTPGTTWFGKLDYCSRCALDSNNPQYGNPQTGNFPVVLSATPNYWTHDPVNGTNYCECCEPQGCSTILPANHPSCVKCLSNQNAGFPIPPGGAAAGAPGSGDNCECCDTGTGDNPCTGDNPSPECYWCPVEGNTSNQCQQVGGNLNYAVSNGFNLYQNQVDCHQNEECGPNTHSGDRCNLEGSYDDPNQGQQSNDYNDAWGMGCWFCDLEGHYGPGCTMIQSPMHQWRAYQSFLAGNQVTADPAVCNQVNQCEEPTHSDDPGCVCCDATHHQPVMPVINQNYKSCSSYNTNPSFYGCVPSPQTPLCKSTLPDIPNDAEPMAKVSVTGAPGKKSTFEPAQIPGLDLEKEPIKENTLRLKSKVKKLLAEIASKKTKGCGCNKK